MPVSAWDLERVAARTQNTSSPSFAMLRTLWPKSSDRQARTGPDGGGMSIAEHNRRSRQAAELDPSLAELITSVMKRYVVPGLALGLHSDGQQWLHGFGLTSVENPLSCRMPQSDLSARLKARSPMRAL